MRQADPHGPLRARAEGAFLAERGPWQEDVLARIEGGFPNLGRIAACFP